MLTANNNSGSSSNNNGLGNDKKRSPLTPKSPILPQPESKSPGSAASQKTPTTLSRQGTLRASHRRKNSMTGSLVLVQGRRSPVGFNDRSPQGRRSPLAISSDRLRSPNELPLHPAFTNAHSPTGDRRSPTLSMHTQERRSPIGAAAPPFEFGQTTTISIAVGEANDDIEGFGSRTPTGHKRPSINLFTPIHFGPGVADKRSPISGMPIPPIHVSNPMESNAAAEARAREEREKLEAAAAREKEQQQQQPEKKERSVMREILAFVRKPSKNLSTRTNRFANAFTRAESGSSSGPLIRQSTFSASPAAASTAAKSAVVKQMSEVGYEPKTSFKFAHYTKMSLKLRRSTVKDDERAKQAASGSSSKRASSDSTAAASDGSTQQIQVSGAVGCGGRASPMGDLPFELANVHFEKVGDSYIKHEKIHEEEDANANNGVVVGIGIGIDAAAAVTKVDDDERTITASFVEEITNSLKIVSLSSENAQITTPHHFQRRSESREPIEPRISEEHESDSNDLIIPEDFRAELIEILNGQKSEPLYVNLQELRRETQEAEAAAKLAASAALGTATTVNAAEKSPLQCPIIEFEPPSRRSSFDPPRSPFLDNLRSPGGDTDTGELINLQRLDSGGDSFEMVDIDRKSSRAESSFEYPYSSRDTSFDISRYQSTSYEDQTSSFEIVEMKKSSNIDLRKSSIELVDAETFQRSGSSCGRKSSLETHFDYTPSPSDVSGLTPARSPNFPLSKKQKTDTFRMLPQTSSNYSSRDSYDSSSSYPHSAPPMHVDVALRSPFADPSKKHFPLTIKQREEEVKTFLCTDQRCASIFEPRPSSVLTQQLSTGSMSTPSGYGNGTPRVLGATNSFIAGGSGTVGPCGGPSFGTGVGIGISGSSNIGGGGACGGGFSSGSEFDPPSPRRAVSASPKHTFTFRIVLKKVDSSPEALCPERHRSRIIDRYRRRDSRRKRLHDAGKSF